MAPTHSAKKNGINILGKSPNISFMTIASFIYNPYINIEGTSYIFIDEMSMVDNKNFYKILNIIIDGIENNILKDIHIVLVGDSNQLEPIDIGCPFKDIINIIPTYKLTKNFRSLKTDIPLFCDIILGESTYKKYWSINKKYIQDMKNIYIYTYKNTFRNIYNKIEDNIMDNNMDNNMDNIMDNIMDNNMDNNMDNIMDKTMDKTMDNNMDNNYIPQLKSVLRKLKNNNYVPNSDNDINKKTFQIVTLTNKDCINISKIVRNEFSHIYNKSNKIYEINDPIVIKKNTPIFKNGDMGHIINIKYTEDESNIYSVQLQNILSIEERQKLYKKNNISDIDDIEYIEYDVYLNIIKVRSEYFKPCFAITVHGSQGLGFDVIIYIINNFCNMVNMNLNYTAYSRAKKDLYLIGNEKGFNGQKTREKSTRNTILKYIIKNIDKYKKYINTS